MTFLVTGGRGFFGTHLCAYLRRSHPRARIIVLDRTPGPKTLRCDLNSDPQLARRLRQLQPDVIFHLAGSSRADTWDRLWTDFVGATINLLDAVRSLPRPEQPRIIISGSSAEYGPAPDRLLRESDPTRPVTAYGALKLSQTLAALTYRHVGLDIVIARIANIIGPGIPENLALGTFARQLASIARGRRPAEILTGNLDSRRDYIDVRDAAAALDLLARHGKSGEIYNVASGRPLTTGALLRRLIRRSSVPASVRSTAPRRIHREASYVACSYRKINRLTGWRPRIPLERTLKDTWDWALSLPAPRS
ncbi:MAG: NAD-dependent epimerase/dehydratase family protein [Elusimicrobiota bacterium]|jgi:GDP-4-dehydro-6-deoxy-D-mannose reductase